MSDVSSGLKLRVEFERRAAPIDKAAIHFQDLVLILVSEVDDLAAVRRDLEPLNVTHIGHGTAELNKRSASINAPAVQFENAGFLIICHIDDPSTVRRDLPKRDAGAQR